MELKEEDIVNCTVERIDGTTVFVKIEDYGPGTLVLSEIAAGRIRNLREYVIPGKKIVCKVLKVHKDHLELSLRRVTAKEREESEGRYKKGRVINSILKTITNDSEKIIEKIKQKQDIVDLFEQAKTNIHILSEFLNKDELEKLKALLAEKKEKEKEIKKEINIKDTSPNGLIEIKEVLDIKEANISYLGASRFSITTNGKDFKEANQKMDNIIEEIKKRAKERKSIIEIKEK